MNRDGHPLNPRNEKEAQRVAYLISGYLRQTLSEEEHDELDDWMTANDENQQLFEQLTDPALVEEGLAGMDSIDTEAALTRIKARIAFNSPKTKRQYRLWPVWAAAASVVLVAGLWMFKLSSERTEVRGNGGQLAISGTLEPGRDRATLTSEDGRIIDLTNIAQGDTSLSHVVYTLVDGLIEYKAGVHHAPAIHTIHTPAGGQYRVVLSDGTKVWLNASTTLKYPVVFTDSARIVELEGEGYFEVATLSPKGGLRRVPFIVKTDKMEVEVLGTHFNVSTYGNTREVVLLEGRVAVGRREAGDVKKELMPGQRAAMVNGAWQVESGVDTSVAVAWKNGKFQFKNADIETIMQQVARWYDAEVVYEGRIPTHHFNATIYRNEPLEKLLSLLAETDRVRFELEGRRIVVRGE
jgi:transmembrane sensor